MDGAFGVGEGVGTGVGTGVGVGVGVGGAVGTKVGSGNGRVCVGVGTGVGTGVGVDGLVVAVGRGVVPGEVGSGCGGVFPPSVGVDVGEVGSDVMAGVLVSVATGVVGRGWVTTTGFGPDST